jgi:hypothetical protein
VTAAAAAGDVAKPKPHATTTEVTAPASTTFLRIHFIAPPLVGK